RRAGRARAAVHRAARQLERSIGTDLFEVTSFGVRPTREAARLALRTRLAFAEIAQAQAEVAAAQGTGSGSTVIGAMPLARSAPTLAALARFPWIAPRCDSPLRRHFDALIERLGAQPTLAPIECNSLVAARSLLLASDRVMLSSEHQIHHELETGQLAALAH